MYLIKKINVDNTGKYLSSNIVGFTNKTISSALVQIENEIRNFVVSKYGVEAGAAFRIIDISNLGQVSEPMENCLIVYRVENEPHTFHVYEHTTKKVPGTIYGYSYISEFSRIAIYELEKTENIQLDDDCLPRLEMVSVGPNKNIRIPKAMIVAPMCEVIDQLKSCPRFIQLSQRI